MKLKYYKFPKNKAQGKEWAKYPFGVMKEDEDRKKEDEK